MTACISVPGFLLVFAGIAIAGIAFGKLKTTFFPPNPRDVPTSTIWNSTFLFALVIVGCVGVALIVIGMWPYLLLIPCFKVIP